MVYWLRWALLLPAAYAAWLVSLIAGIVLYSLLETLCPAEQMISDMCVAPWFHAASEVVFCVGAGLAAALVLTFCTLLAPSHKAQTSLAAFIAGSLVAIGLGALTEAYAEAICAIGTGAIMLRMLRYRLARAAMSSADPARP